MTITLTTFIPGTKAKADEVNSNFSVLKEAIEEKAAIDGDSNQTFLVADATDDNHAVNKSQLDTLEAELITKIDKTGTKFCVKKGNTSSGEGNLFSYSVLKITSKIAGTYDNLVISDYLGTQTTISTTPEEINLTGNSDGEYNIFINTEGELYILNNTIYKQASRPTMVVNDIWLNTSCEPFECIKYSGTNDEEFLDVPLGKVTIENSAITLLETFPFNQNSYNVTSQTTIENGTKLAMSIPNFVMPDYENGSSKSVSTVYQAPTDGYFYIRTPYSGTFYVSSGNANNDSNYSWTALVVNSFGDQAYTSSVFLPIPKSMYYKFVGNSSATLKFFPCLGV